MEIRNINLYPTGQQKINWVRDNMPLLRYLEDDFRKKRYFEGIRVVVSVHLEAKTAYLAKILAAGGAQVFVTGSNPLSTQDDVAAALAKDGLDVFAWHDCTPEEYERHLNMTLDGKPNIVIDDGGDLVNLLHGSRRELLEYVWGGCEETTTGVLRLKARAREDKLEFPMISVNDAYCKYLFDNRYGTGQSVWDGINRTTNLIVSGKTVVVAGYGWCGKGVAMRAKGLGANVVITEIDPIMSLEAVMDGYRVMPMSEAAKIGDMFITVTGCRDVITKEHFNVMKNGALLANAGHFDVEVSVSDLDEISVSKQEVRKNIVGYTLKNGNRLNLIAQGRLVNLAAGDGHPAEIMDLSFALQALCAKHIALNHPSMDKDVYDVPKEIDSMVGALKLKLMGYEIDTLTKAQEDYLNGYSH